MKSYCVPFYLIVVLLVGAVAFIVVQYKTIQQLTKEIAEPGPKSGTADQLRAELKAILERTDAEHRELLRLRGNVSALREKEKEIATLKSEREQVAQQAQKIAQAAIDQSAPEQIAEKRRTMARLNYSRQIGLSLIMAASDNGDQLPPNLDELEGKYLQRSAEMDEHNLQMGQFELLYKGKLDEAQEPGRTVLSREKEPSQRTDGTWQRVYVFLDGHSQVLLAPGREELLQREKEQFILPVQP
jgi:hypothetical protein